jgi:hypothetical protein
MSTRMRRPDYTCTTDDFPIEYIEEDFVRSRYVAIRLHNESILTRIDRSRRRSRIMIGIALSTVIITLLAIFAS